MSEHNYEEPLPILEEGMVLCPNCNEEVDEEDICRCERCWRPLCKSKGCSIDTDYGRFCDTDDNGNSECFEEYMELVEAEK